MSLLINGINMSDSCSKCPLKYSSYDMYCCRVVCGDGCIVCVDSYTERRNPACPLVEIPTPHGRLIDADKLKGAVLEAMCRGIDVSITQLIDKAPTVIEKENAQ